MSTDLYQELLSAGKVSICHYQECGQYKKQLQDLYDFVYVVECTPCPEEPTYSPMFLDCIIHRTLWEKIQKRLEKENLSYDVLDYCEMKNVSHHIPNTPKRKLMFEMLGRWWFFQDTLPPTIALKEAVEFRKKFFKQEFAYLPETFRERVKTIDFPTAIQSLTEEEHQFLDRLIAQYNDPIVSCGCIPNKKSAFSQRLQNPDWYELPELSIYEMDGIDIRDVGKAVDKGDFLYMVVSNFHDCMDRSLYQKLYNIFKEETD